MEGPYRDLGAGFARLTGAEGARRGPSRVTHIEDALLELLRNARDAAAKNVYVASTLKGRRYRSLTVLDDGHGVPISHKDLIFEAGVTTRHLDPVVDQDGSPSAPHGAGLSLYHIREAAVEASVQSTSDPTSIKVTFDTHAVPERTLQSASRPSRTNLLATLENFAATNPLNLYHGPPARILATLLKHRIIHNNMTSEELRRGARELGLEVSRRTVQRIRGGEIAAVGAVSGARRGHRMRRRSSSNSSSSVKETRGRAERGDGPMLMLGERERAEIEAILRRAAKASYLEFEGIKLELRPGEIAIKGLVYEPEEEYE
ncbi:MAG: ATP-binding protein [Actinomycetota bacterium]|nr:ATP-binding protein [Actinomycetota bacterium]